MWIFLALVSALCLGCYDVFKKLSVKGNDVAMVLMLNTVFQTMFMSPVIIGEVAQGSLGLGDTVHGHLLILVKAVIVLSSWLLGYFAIKHLPLTIQGPINASRPVMVLVGALLIFGERLNLLQWVGILLGFASLYFIAHIGSRDSRWLWMAIGATVLGAISALYDKYLLQYYRPTDVQAWYSLYQCIIMTATLLILRRCSPAMRRESGGFRWRWTIPFISVFLTVADLAYFYSLSIDGAMISVISMVRRGSVIVPFIYGVLVLHEKNVRAKAVDLGVLFLSLILLVIGSQQ